MFLSEDLINRVTTAIIVKIFEVLEQPFLRK